MMPTMWFLPCALMALAGALGVVRSRGAVASAFHLVLVFFAFAGLYAGLGADFLAGIQILVYAGAILVLFVFVVMLLQGEHKHPQIAKPIDVRLKVLTAGFAAFFVIYFAGVFRLSEGGRTLGSAGVSPKATAGLQQLGAPGGGNTVALAEILFSQAMLPFELTAIVLLSAMVGAVVTAKRNKAGGGGGRSRVGGGWNDRLGATSTAAGLQGEKRGMS